MLKFIPDPEVKINGASLEKQGCRLWVKRLCSAVETNYCGQSGQVHYGPGTLRSLHHVTGHISIRLAEQQKYSICTDVARAGLICHVLKAFPKDWAFEPWGMFSPVVI